MSAMDEEILRLNDKCRKIIADPRKMENLPELLETLEQTAITADVLTKTRIGMTLNELRKKINDEKLAKRAKVLIRKWKVVLEEAANNKPTENGVKDGKLAPKKPSVEPKKSASPPSDDNSNSNQSELKPSGDSKPAPSPKPAANTYLNILKRDLPKDEKRNKNIKLLFDSLKVGELPEHTQDPEEVAARVEEALYNKYGDTTNDYFSAVRTRIFNLRDKKNPALRENILTGAVSPERFAQMTTAEMASEAMKQQREAFTKEAILEHQMAVTEGTPSDMFKCGRCGGKNCTYNQMQTRSADEPMTTFVFCRGCGNRWKFC